MSKKTKAKFFTASSQLSKQAFKLETPLINPNFWIPGRIACELSSADELLLTEMMFNGLFNDLEPAQAASILSCFVCDERSNEMPKLTGELSGPLRTMQDMAKRIASVSKECKIEIDEELYVGKFKPYMMDIVYEWCKGATFMQLCKMTDIFEGMYLQGIS